MTDPRLVLSAMMEALVAGTYGCLDAAAETIHARWGRGCSKGTLSKKGAGLLDWTVLDVMALEDGAGRYPVTRWLMRRAAAQAGEAPKTGSRDMVTLAAVISREAGEAVSAILSAELSASASDRAQAETEIAEAIEVLQAARARLMAAGGPEGDAGVAVFTAHRRAGGAAGAA